MGRKETQPKGSNLDPALVVIGASNSLIEIRGIAPGSEAHAVAMENLTDLLVKTPEAIAKLKGQQNGNS